MRILFDHQIFLLQQYGGVSRYHVELMQNLNMIESCTVDVPILFYKSEYLRKNRKRKVDSQCNQFLFKVYYAINAAYTFFNTLIKSYDIIHPTWVEYDTIIFKRAVRIVTIHDMIHELFWSDSAQKEIKRKKRAIFKADAIIAISENTKRDILDIYPEISPEKVTVIYHGTNHLPEPCVPTNIKIPNRYVLFVGMRNDYKNANTLIQAMSEIVAHDRSIYLMFFGGGSITDDEMNSLIEYGIWDNVIQYAGSDAELAYLYQHALCFVYPSKYEGFGFPILEAFDNDCPVICSNTSSLPEVAGDAALYFQPEIVTELVKQIETLICDSDLRNELIYRGKERVKLFTWEKTAKKTIEFYERCTRAKLKKTFKMFRSFQEK